MISAREENDWERTSTLRLSPSIATLKGHAADQANHALFMKLLELAIPSFLTDVIGLILGASMVTFFRCSVRLAG
ncbi:MAG: hypothetical protein ACI8T1_003769 [Verrucomicrobiales bacterium]|jgi:hypothetical protein